MSAPDPVEMMHQAREACGFSKLPAVDCTPAEAWEQTLETLRLVRIGTDEAYGIRWWRGLVRDTPADESPVEAVS